MNWPWAKEGMSVVAIEPIPDRPEPDVYDVTLEHYLIKTIKGQEYQVWADAIRYDSGAARQMTTFLETASFFWVWPTTWSGPPTLLYWKRSASYRTLLEIRSSYILSIESIGSKVKEVECR